MTVSSNTKKPALQRSIPYGAPYAYEMLAEKKNRSIQENSISLDLDGGVNVGASLSSILLSFDNNRSVASSDDDSYSYSCSDESDDGGRLGATPSKKRGGCLSKKKRGRFLSISPVRSSEDNENETLDIPGCSDWSVDISRMSVPALMIDRGDEEPIAQDANTAPYEVAADDSLENSPNESSHNDVEISITLREQLESLGLRLDSLENAIFSNNDDLNGTSTVDVDVGDQNQNMAFIVEEDDSTIESVVDEVVVSEAEDIDNDSARKTRRSKQSFFVRFFFLGGCRKQW
eukprot:CAMPEP_0201723360 /NCGR_PEP_ID=MMETSP0593-20130828/7435_1 /ASSEMBLY_ACC=CAM_ASM_000672 /TAXON_ID=267983 /ORGANISM="Skeletonema japonicum, Strain CCMP2506" /LENGTH=288 /DNA_ID=CAMNT_0048214457 /DNA_START=52 /DNA_END=915 /DNA_ORIENTATION=-